MSEQKTEIQLTLQDWSTETKPTWCPGCGDFGVLKSTQNALADGQWNLENTVVVSGIGCSSNLPHFIGGYGVHTLHGRAVPVAEGIKLSNPELNVIVTGGDGDGLAIGVGGFLHAARRNFNLTYIIMDNQVYGLTVNQVSPTSGLERVTRSTPYGNIESPFNPVLLALSAGATFVARTFSGDPKHFAQVVEQAMEHKGFAFVDALSPCVTFNNVNTYKFWKDRVYQLEEDDGYDRTDLGAAFVKAREFGDKVPIGVLYQEQKPTYEEQDPTIAKFGSVVKRGAHHLAEDIRKDILADFM